MKGFFEAPSRDNDQRDNRECYEFNEILGSSLDDDDYPHCHKYLTVQCEHIDEFINYEV